MSVFGDLEDPHQYLYHYTTRQAALDAILPTGRIRLGLLRHTNDPREAKEWRFGGATPPGETGISNEEYLETMLDAARLAQATTKLLCLTRDDPVGSMRPPNEIFGRGFSHSRMWTQYADGHRGVCLVFDKQALASAIQVELGGKGRLWHGPVTYADEEDDELRAFTLWEHRILKLGLNTAIAEHLEAHHKALLFRKNTDWATEWEYRWVLHSAEPAPEFVPIENCLRGVIRGDAFPEDDRDIYRHAVGRYDGVEMGLCRWLNGGPQFIPGGGEPGGAAIIGRVRVPARLVPPVTDTNGSD